MKSREHHSTFAVRLDLGEIFALPPHLARRLARLEKDSGFRASVETIERLRRDPRKDKSFSGSFLALASVAVARRANRETWKGVWALGTNKTWKALEGFPKRLRGMADEVERVSGSPLFDFESWISKGTIGGLVVKHRLRQLPGILNLYAACIELITKRLPTVILEREGVPSWEGGNSQPVLLLSQLVKVLTGRFCDKEVANLLNAAAHALGESFKIDALDLAQARYRRRGASKT